MPPKLPEHGPLGNEGYPGFCCGQDWKYEHARKQSTEFQCWHCGKRWEWDMYAHVWKQR